MESSGLQSSRRESETQRLERHAETFTQRLEKERRLGLQLDETVKGAFKVLQERQAAVKATLAQRQANARLQEQVDHLELNLNRAKLELGDLAVTNRRLRTEIDSLRKGNVEGLNTSSRLTSTLEHVQQTAATANKRACKSVLREQGARHRLLSLQDSRGLDQMGLSLRLHSLKGEIAEDRKARQALLQSLMNAPVSADMSESGLVAKHLGEKWLSLVKDKRREVDAYQRYVTDISAGFTQMKAYSSIESLSSVVLSFLNSLERQREIQKHLVILSELMEEVAQELSTARLYVDRVSLAEHSHSAEFLSLQSSRSQQLQFLRSQVDTQASTLSLVCKEVEVLHGPLHALYQMAMSLDLKPRLCEPVEFTETSDFTVETAPLYLVQMEELVEQLTAILRVPYHNHANPDTPKAHSLTLDTTNFPLLSEEDYPLSPVDFRKRAQKALGLANILTPS